MLFPEFDLKSFWASLSYGSLILLKDLAVLRLVQDAPVFTLMLSEPDLRLIVFTFRSSIGNNENFTVFQRHHLFCAESASMDF